MHIRSTAQRLATTAITLSAIMGAGVAGAPSASAQDVTAAAPMHSEKCIMILDRGDITNADTDTDSATA